MLAFSNGCPRMSGSATLCPDPTAGAAEVSWQPSCSSGAIIPCTPGSRGSTCWARLLFCRSEALMHLQYSESFWFSQVLKYFLGLFLWSYTAYLPVIKLPFSSVFVINIPLLLKKFVYWVLVQLIDLEKIQPIISYLSKCYCVYFHIKREEASKFVTSPIVNGCCTQAGTAFRRYFCIR